MNIRFKNLTFDRMFLSARTDSGKKLTFTRAERALLIAFTANGQRLLTRNQLLDAMASTAETSDRNIDHLVNRLRAKLGDSARNSSMIATRYGEGYIWIAERMRGEADDDSTLLVIGPVSGLARMSSTSAAYALLEQLQQSLDALTADERIIALDETWDASSAVPGSIRFSLDVSFYDDEKCLHCAAVLRQAATRQMLATYRFAANPDGTLVGWPDFDELARSITHAMWNHTTTGQGVLVAPMDVPLELRMHDASRLFVRSDESWTQMGEQIARMREHNRDDPQTDLMWAMHLYARIVTNPVDVDRCDEFIQDIEAIVFDRLPALQDNPVFLLGAAKLLLFVGRGHLDLAEVLAEQAFASSSAFASSFATIGQVRMLKGDVAQAVDLYDRGIDLAETHSEFHIYLLVLKCAALAAADDRTALNQVLAQLEAIKPATRYQVSLSMAPAGPLAPDFEMAIAQFDTRRAGQAIAYLHCIFGRLFVREEHRENIMRGLIVNMSQRFGEQIVPEEVWRSVPRLREARRKARP